MPQNSVTSGFKYLIWVLFNSDFAGHVSQRTFTLDWTWLDDELELAEGFF